MTPRADNGGYAVVVPVGPQPLEVERLRDLIDSFAGNEQAPGTIVMVDDSPVPRHLDRIIEAPKPVRLVGLHHAPVRRKRALRGKGVSSAVMLGMRWVQAHTDAAYAIKLDTDSLVIGPFHERISTFFHAHPTVGQIGAYSLSPNGSRREWETHAALIRYLKSPFHWGNPARRRFRMLYKLAKPNGHFDAEHCLGGGYALSRAALDNIASAGFLADPLIWAEIDSPEEIIVAVNVRAIGLGFANFVDEGEVFGTKYIGLAYAPPELVRRGYAIIHAVKNDEHLTENEIRQYFRARRAANQH